MFGEYAIGLHDDPSGAGRWTGFLALLFPLFGAYRLVTRSPRTTWPRALCDGLTFGAVGGVVSGGAILVYFVFVNPEFGPDDRPVQAGATALAAFLGALLLGALSVLVMRAVFGRDGGSRG